MTKFVNTISDSDIAIEIFSCRFEPVNDYQWVVHVNVEGQPEHLAFKLSLYDADLLRRDLGRNPPIASDLIELAAIVYAVDRSIRPREASHCKVYATVPVRCSDLLSQNEIYDKLTEILYWYTGYDWHFCFTSRATSIRASERPQLFDWYEQSEPVEVGLWSGGLDCLAGLYNRAFENPNQRFVLCGTGASDRVYSLQKQIADLLPKSLAARIKLLRVHYSIETQFGNLPDEPRMRSRGFTFMLIGAVCAYLEGSRNLQVYENGIGAINLRFRASEVGLNHARSVHPLSLMLMAEWLTQVFGEPFELNNPFLFQTKAQMCRIIASKGDLAIAFQTETCDRQHRRSDAQQCGRCSSCILRRHAFAVLGVEDQTPYVYDALDWLHVPVMFETVEAGNHIPAALYQVENLYQHLLTSNPWNSLVNQYEILAGDIVDRTSAYYGLSEEEMRMGLLHLFSQYVDEWQSLQYVP